MAGFVFDGDGLSERRKLAAAAMLACKPCCAHGAGSGSGHGSTRPRGPGDDCDCDGGVCATTFSIDLTGTTTRHGLSDPSCTPHTYPSSGCTWCEKHAAAIPLALDTGSSPFCTWSYHYTTPPPYGFDGCNESFDVLLRCFTNHPTFGTGWLLSISMNAGTTVLGVDFIITAWHYKSTDFNCVDGGTFSFFTAVNTGC